MTLSNCFYSKKVIDAHWHTRFHSYLPQVERTRNQKTLKFNAALPEIFKVIEMEGTTPLKH